MASFVSVPGPKRTCRRGSTSYCGCRAISEAPWTIVSQLPSGRLEHFRGDVCALDKTVLELTLGLKRTLRSVPLTLCVGLMR
jgi:hypothetical protein